MKNSKLIRILYTALMPFILGSCTAVYAIAAKQTGVGIPCLFYTITGLYCPGCGMTRMIAAILDGDFTAAMHYNCAAFFLLPFGIIIYLCWAYRYITTGNLPLNKYENIALYALLIIFVVFGILRNIT